MIKVIPAIDLYGGQCVRLLKGDFAQKTNYATSPLAMSKIYEDEGFDKLHVIDLEGAEQQKSANKSVIKEIANNSNLKIQVGGGIRSIDQVSSLFDSGIDSVILGSAVIKNPSLFEELALKFDKSKFIIAVDVRNTKVMYEAWKEESDFTIEKCISFFAEMGATRFLCTDIDVDGTLEGPSFNLYQSLKEDFPAIELIASGGVGTIEDVKTLENMGINEVVVGKAIYENIIPLNQLKKYN